jgi:hypothetical protein
MSSFLLFRSVIEAGSLPGKLCNAFFCIPLFCFLACSPKPQKDLQMEV